MILLIDNYDSFSYNLYQLLGTIKNDIKVIRNDELSIEEIKDLSPKLIVISPGPGKPKDSGICIEAILHFSTSIPIFGVCLGHQAINVAFGGIVGYAKEVIHGKTSNIDLDNTSCLFHSMPKQIQVARYHSLCIQAVPKCLKVVAQTKDGEIMAIQHKQYPIFGVQFHPESIMTPLGKQIVENIINKAFK